MPLPKRQFPLATVALYGPDDKFATKLVVSIFPSASMPSSSSRQWTTQQTDIREDLDVRNELTSYLKEQNVVHSVVTDGILGCPHEEGIDYPAGGFCPQCSYWARRLLFPKELVEQKVSAGRNDPCACGSGKKYKKCCGAPH